MVLVMVYRGQAPTKLLIYLLIPRFSPQNEKGKERQY